MRRGLVLGSLIVVGVALIAASFLPRRPMLIWNFTASAPVGLYRALPRSWERGDWVAVEPGATTRVIAEHLGVLERGRLLVKRVAAAEGDEVCRHGGIVTINGVERAIARDQTSTGLALPNWQGCVLLHQGDVFLLGQAPQSFDGRYFGVTGAAEIIAPLEFVLGR